MRTETLFVEHGKKPTEVSLSDLLLDKDNPRFGFQDNAAVSQDVILDRIVEKFGVDDVLSSLAVNGYFSAEPMVCRRLENSEKAVVVEGNRRLAACLILTGDSRAKSQATRTRDFRAVWEEHGRRQIDPAPVIIFEAHEQEQAILSYLGVRHIASSQPWDSYAKAAWVAQVIEKNGLSIKEVSLMIGDQHRTVGRLLEGYYFIRQLIDEGVFRPEDSIRKGRGSVTEYPFSWVYTILGYSPVRQFLGLGDQSPEQRPVKPERLAKAALLTSSMFGVRSKGQSAAVEDSRELGDLASAVANPEKVTLLEQGKTLREIKVLTQPLEERLRTGL
ncbi:MAG: hypothetical protein AB1918_03340, partial [Pseudomonadota bacterium]